MYIYVYAAVKTVTLHVKIRAEKKVQRKFLSSDTFMNKK